MNSRKRIKHVRLKTNGMFVSLDRLDVIGLYELVVSDNVGPIKFVLISTISCRDAKRQFTNWIHQNYPQVETVV